MKDNGRDMLVQANPLIEARKPLKALEMRLFLLALQDINPHLSEKDRFYDKDFKMTHIPPSGVKQIFGHGQYLARLERACDDLMERTVKVREADGGFTIYTIFDVIRYKPQEGLSIQFNHHMRPFLLDIYENGHGYTKISMRQIFNLSSAYGMRLLELMLQYKGTMQDRVIRRRIALDDLRFWLDVPEDSYKRISDVRRFVLDVPIAEINEKTQYSLSYEPWKNGRCIAGFLFTMDCSGVVLDSAATVTLEMEPPESEWHGLSRPAVSKLVAICGSNEEFRKRMEHAVSLLPKRKPKNVPAFLYKAVEQDYLQRDLELRTAVEREMQAQETIRRLSEAIRLDEDAAEIPFDLSDPMEQAMIRIVRKAMKERRLDATSRRILEDHGMRVERFLALYGQDGTEAT